MLQWMSQHASTLNAFVNVFTLVFWIFYANLLVAGFRRQRSPLLLINAAAGGESHADCLISNMSQEAVYIQDIMLTLYIDSEKRAESVTFFRDMAVTRSASEAEGVDGDVADVSRGPLGVSKQMNIGTFRHLVDKACGKADSAQNQQTCGANVTAINITVIGFYGPSASIVGAQRRFSFDGSNRSRIAPTSISTRQLNRWWHHRRVRAWVRQKL